MTLNTFIQLHFVEYKKRPKQVQISCNICTPDLGGVPVGIFDGGVPLLNIAYTPVLNGSQCNKDE